MNVNIDNRWRGCSMRDGGCFPITVFEVYADIHPSYRYFEVTVLNFSLVIQRGR